MDRIVLAGGSGFLGQALAEELVRKGYEVVVLTRAPSPGSGPVRRVGWDGKSVGEWASLIDGARAVVNLTGKSVNCRHTEENREEIVSSRVDSVKAVGAAIARCSRPPEVLVQAASLAIYGDAGDRICDETSPAGSGFTVECCAQWELAWSEARSEKTRQVLLRIGIALGANGGALEVLGNLTKWLLGGTVGSGDQYVSWLHLRDLNRIFLAAIEEPEMSGVFNATSPNPVTNREFMREMRRALHRPWSPPAPSWAVRIGSFLMGTEASLALTGRRCIPKRLQERGFRFEMPDLPGTLRDLFGD